MIILDRHVDGPGRSIGPLETNPPLVVDPDAVVSGPAAFQLLESMPRKIGDVAQTGRGIEPIERPFRLTAERLELFDPLPLAKLRRPTIAIAPDHGPQMPLSMSYVKRKSDDGIVTGNGTIDPLAIFDARFVRPLQSSRYRWRSFPEA
jgi:hypothetical protein